VPNLFARRFCGQRFAGGLIFLLCAQAPASTPSPDWFARAWQSEDRLPNNTVGGIAQTADGYLWFGTPSGLVRFDGIRFEEFSPTNFVDAPYRGTELILRGHDGALWLAMDRGAVVCLNGNSSRAFTTNLPAIIPNGLAEDAEGAVWVAYRLGSVYRIKDGQVTAFGKRDGLPEGESTDICALTTDARGRIWFAKAGQVGMVRDGVFQTLLHFEPAATRLAPARSGGVWFCSGFRLYKIEENAQFQDFGEFHPERAGTIATALLEDREGAVWIGTSFSGLFRHGDTGFEAIDTTHLEILSLLEDREGNLWVGTHGGGLNRIRRRAISLEGVDAGLPFGAVQSLCEDTNGHLWAATQNGALARRQAGRWAALTAADHCPEDVTCEASDRRGTLWIGTRQRGLYSWREGQFKRWEGTALRGQTIHTLLASRAGDLWIGEETPNAIERLRGGELTTFEIAQDARVIRAMAEDAAGDVWAGTSKGVLLRIVGDKLCDATPRPADELASIRCLTPTPDGALWIGYVAWGVGRIKDGRYTEIRAEQGLYDDYISHIVADERGWLWFGANLGIFKVRQEELEDVALGHASRVRSIHYGRGEGLPSLQANFGDSPDVLRSRDGRLWIPMRNALVVVDPEKFSENSDPPPVLLNRVMVDERTLARYSGVLPPAALGTNVVDLGVAESTLRLLPTHRRIEFQFAALSFTAPENVQFRYRLEGYDENWMEGGTVRSVTYSRLPAGSYVFRVLACNGDVVWNKTGAVLSLVVAPFFWQTWYFRLSVLGGFTLAVVMTVRYISFRRLRLRLLHLEQQAALQNERARIAKDIHDDLGASLTQIALLGELARQDRAEPDKAGDRVTTISATARQAIKSLDEIVWAVNPRNDTLAHLIDYAGQFAVDFLRATGVRCRLDLPDQAPDCQLSTDIRHNLFLAIKEALHNVVKHSRATEAWLRVHVAQGALEIIIEDNGCGFAAAPENAMADGLRNMQQRLAELGGVCRISSRPGEGTCVSLKLAWSGS
jgi:signal transduction histidine kinase/ligand-binding sensor domain-containing protein